MTSDEIRGKFLSFFENRGHKILPGSSLVPEDPSLLLTTAGMVQFKPIFEGKVKPKHPRVATAQRCVRTTDIERVGKTARHLTFFEMLGNFSFGDYYKQKIIPWAWEFLTEDLQMDPEKLWITVYKDDEEAFDIWKKDAGVPEEKIFRLGGADNFWAAGPTGSCGPCTELIYDFGVERDCGRTTCGVNCDCDRYLEVWNLVFMQYDRDENGKLHPLSKKGVDTGLGLERAAAILQNALTTFETDLLKPLVKKTEELSGAKYGKNLKKDVSLKIVADHARAVTFLINDGVLPSNEGRGYVLRRLLRRAVRHGKLLSIRETFLSELADTVIDIMKNTYPDVFKNQDFIKRIIENEEGRFSETLKTGLSILNDVIEQVKTTKGDKIGGEAIFRLYDTYGFPPELTREIAEESGIPVDLNSFDQHMEAHRTKARASWKEEAAVSEEIYAEVLDYAGKTDFVGYSERESGATIKAIIRGKVAVSEAKSGEEIEIVLNKTPFYAEMGGQIGDTGIITTDTGKMEVLETKAPLPEMYVHRGKIVEGVLKSEQEAIAKIDEARREEIAKNHTATHLLHWALRKVLGSHVRQGGSLVAPDRLRFDFTHFQALSPEEIEKIERLVNEKIAQNYPVRTYQTSLDFAKESGALAFFGEKYGDVVRILEIGDFSKELCGGTHVGRTSEINMVKIISEASIGANLRRIEAISSVRAWDYFNREDRALKGAASILGVKKDEVVKGASNLLSSLKEKEKQIENLQLVLRKEKVREILASARQINNVRVVMEEVGAQNMEYLRALVDSLKEKLGRGIIILAATSKGKALLVAAVTPNLIRDGFNAEKILDSIAPVIGGGGGGRADLAQAGGKKPEKLPQAFEKALSYIEDSLTGIKNN